MLEAHIYHSSAHLPSFCLDNYSFTFIDDNNTEHNAWTALGKRKDKTGNAIPTVFLYIEKPSNNKGTDYKLIEIPTSSINSQNQLKSIALNHFSGLSKQIK